jgi:hypothetical protein
MRKFLGAVALVCALPAMAQADSFTFVSRNDILNRVVAPVAGSKTIVVTATYPNRKVVSKSQCATWPAPPGGLFTTSGACVATDADGIQYTVVVSCRAVEGSVTVGDCFGQLTGTAGAYRGRTGTVSWRSTQSADGKVSTATGTGMWN